MITPETPIPRAAVPVSEPRRPRRRWVLAPLGLVLVIGVSAGLAYRHLAEGSRRETHRTLAVIAEQKRSQIEDRLAQSRIDAELYFTGHAQVARLLAEWLAGGRQDADLLARMRARVEEVSGVRGWGGVVLRDAQARSVLAVGGSGAPAQAPAPYAPPGAVGGRPEVRFVDLHRTAQGEVEFGFLAPVSTPGSPGLGSVYLSHSAARALYPLVQTWPVPTRSAETYLVRRDGALVEYLSPLRYGDGAPLTLTRPLDDPDLSAARAARGEQGILDEAHDYRGVPVLAYATPIAGTPWMMIAEIDRDEAYAAVRKTAWATVLIVGLGLLLVYLAGYARWRRERMGRELAALRARQEVEARFRAVFEQSPLGMALQDGEGRVTEVNRRFTEILGWSPVDGETLHGLADAPCAGPRPAPDAGPRARTEHRWQRPDGGQVWIEVGTAPMALGPDEGPRRLCIIEDISQRRRMELALSTSEERYRLALEATSEGLWDANVATGEIVVNDRWFTMFGYAPGEVSATFALWKTHLHPDDAPAIFRAQEDYLTGRSPSYEIEYRVITRGGEVRWHRSVGKLVARGGDGAPLRMVGTNADVTERVRTAEQIRETMRSLELATRAADIGVWSWEIKSDRLHWDQRLCAWYEVPEETRASDLLYPFWKSRVHPDDRVHAEARLLASVREQRPQDDVFRIVLPGGRIRYIHSAWVVELDAAGEPVRVLGVNRDITAQRELEQGLEAAREAAETANAAKSAFLAHISHEIRTPLNAVLGLTQLLEKTALAAEQWHMVHLIHNAGRSLLAILNDVLDLSKIEAGQLSFEQRSFDLTQVLAQIESLLGTTARAKGIGLIVAPPEDLEGALIGDPLRLEQVMANLIGNAIKFTERGRVEVRARLLDADPARVRLRFEVTDTGIGIEPAVLEGLFRPYVQADGSIARRFGGTGLGLAICKHLVELQGGVIGAESRPGEGSTFWFELTFPRDTGVGNLPEPVPEPAVSAGPRLAGRHFLVVDDSAVNRDLVRQMLGMEGAQATLAEDGRQALQFLRANPQGFDAVLMDVQMPILDGLSATRAIRADPGLKHLPVIALTAGVLDAQQAAARAAGVDEVLAKPLDLERMVVLLSARVTPRPERTAESGPRPAERDDAGEFPPIAGIDRARVAQTLGNNRALFLRLLDGFIAESAGLSEQTRRDLAAGERLRAQRRLHTLRGNAGSLGALEIMATAGRLEDALAAGANGVDGGLATLDRQLAALVEDSAPWRGGAGAVPDAGPLLPDAIAELCTDLEAQSMNAVRRFETLEAALIDRLGDGAAGALGGAIRGLRFGEALALLEQTGLPGSAARPQAPGAAGRSRASG